jgi:hypothetical protein
VKANVSVPLGFFLAPSERTEVFSIFADALAEKSFSLRDLYEISLLSDAGTALRSSADGGFRRRGYHRRHYLCHRHLLESLGSNTLVSLLARCLLFTRTQDTFREFYPQAIADFALGSQQNLISDARRVKIGKLFRVELTQPMEMNARGLTRLFSENRLCGASEGFLSASQHVQIILKGCMGD